MLMQKEGGRDWNGGSLQKKTDIHWFITLLLQTTLDWLRLNVVMQGTLLCDACSPCASGISSLLQFHIHMHYLRL